MKRLWFATVIALSIPRFTFADSQELCVSNATVVAKDEYSKGLGKYYEAHQYLSSELRHELQNLITIDLDNGKKFKSELIKLSEASKVEAFKRIENGMSVDFPPYQKFNKFYKEYAPKSGNEEAGVAFNYIPEKKTFLILDCRSKPVETEFKQGQGYVHQYIKGCAFATLSLNDQNELITNVSEDANLMFPPEKQLKDPKGSVHTVVHPKSINGVYITTNEEQFIKLKVFELCGSSKKSGSISFNDDDRSSGKEIYALARMVSPGKTGGGVTQ